MENEGFRNNEEEDETEGKRKHHVDMHAHPVTSQTSMKQKYAETIVSSNVALHS